MRDALRMAVVSGRNAGSIPVRRTGSRCRKSAVVAGFARPPRSGR